jgi:hypothetical protein
MKGELFICDTVYLLSGLKELGSLMLLCLPFDIYCHINVKKRIVYVTLMGTRGSLVVKV